MFKATIIEESLENKRVLELGKIISTQIYPSEASTPWIKQWTIHQVEVENNVLAFAQELSQSIDSKHPDKWYANLASEKVQFVIFYHKVFEYRRGDLKERQKAINYGQAIGIPIEQLDWKE